MDARFTPRELHIMQALWALKGGTVAEVRAHLEDPLAYNTVLTILRILEEKGHVSHEAQGRAHRYFSLVDEATAQRTAAGRLIGDLFGGSPSLLLTQLVEDRHLGEDDLERLRALLKEHLGEEDDR